MTDVEQERPKHVNPVPSPEESARKAELVKLLLDYSATHSLSDMSLRPLAAAVGSSPRMLLYFFGSKEGLIREVLAASRARQIQLAEQWLREDGRPTRDPLGQLWAWLSDPAQSGIERLFFEAYGRSLREEDVAWAGFARDSVADWLPLVTRMLNPTREATAESKAATTLVLAALRGLLLDLLATGDRDRVQSAFGLLASISPR